MIWPYLELGSVKNPPLFFLHGFLGAGDDWLPTAERFADDFYCILPDLPGHGRNTRYQYSVFSIQSSLSPLSSSLSPFSFDILAQDLIHLFDHLQLPKVNLVGYSMGGRVALYTAVYHPHRIASLVLEGVSPGITDETARQERTRVDDERAAMLLAEGMETFVEQWYEMGLFRTLKNYPELLANTKEKRKQNNARWMAKVISDLSPGRQRPLWDKLSALTMPVLLLAGELDNNYSTLITQMAEIIPCGTAEIIPQAGHNVHLEKAEQFVRLVRQFLVAHNAG